jgi:Domain of unknown function (DUF1772)
MVIVLQVVTVFLVAFAMSMALAHALEHPGKQRLDEKTYMAVQAIYYPGFTLGGIGEVLAIIATLALALVMRGGGVAFWCAVSAFVAILALHAVFWLVTQPVNKYWARYLPLNKAGKRFFAPDDMSRSVESAAADPNWKRLKNKWEYSHIARAGLSAIALITVSVAIAL